MRVRHKIPSVFNLSMVDVLCCALGCMILLWLLGNHKAKSREQAAAVSLASSEERHAFDEMLITNLTDQVQDLKDEAKKQVVLIGRLDVDLQASKAASVELQGKLAETKSKVLVLQGKLEGQEVELKASGDKSKALTVDLEKLDKQLLVIRKERDKAIEEKKEVEKEKTQVGRDLETVQGKYAASEEALAKVRKELADARKELLAAKKELADLKEQVAKLETEITRLNKELAQAKEKEGDREKRFEGMPLVGKSVIFVVDTSGSMVEVEDGKPDPEKWPTLCKNVARIMRSLPEMKQYQVITFAYKANYLFKESAGKWLDFDGRTSPNDVEKALLAIKPDGGTNLYAAFEEAFNYRTQGLDTVYLFSDGLPDRGEGVTEERAKQLRLHTGKTKEQAQLDDVRLGRELGDYLRGKLKREWNPQKKVRINTIGFFYDTPDVGAFLWGLARDNEGTFVGMSKP